MTPLLAVHQLSTEYRRPDGTVARAVDRVSLHLDRGEVLAVVGESGSGKTTLGLSLLKLVPQPPGRILPGSRVELEGTDLLALDAGALRRIRGGRMAIIFQEPATSLNPVLTIGRQIVEAVRLHTSLGRAAAWRRAAQLLEAVGLADAEHRLRQYPHQLSGGMQQRAMLAMALAGEPHLLIADEPTTALDVTIQAQILELLAALRARLGLAVLLITHDLGVAAALADRIAVMYAGQLVECAPAVELFQRPQHPYTQALLRAAPRTDTKPDRLDPIPGQPPTAAQWPPGCRFHPRCPFAGDRCRAAEPPLLAAGADHQARCWLLERPGAAPA